MVQQPMMAYVFDLKQNVTNIDHGEITNNVDCVIVYGLNCLGVAFDPIAYQLKMGVGEEDITPNIVPTKDNINPLRIYRRDLMGEEDCQSVAKSKLVELARNYSISFGCEYDPRYKVGNMFVIKNSKKIKDTQKWIIKKIDVNINKGDIGMTVTAYSNSVSDFPDNILLPSSGLLDTDVLEITEQITNVTELR